MVNYNSTEVPLPAADVGFSGAVQNRTRWDDNISWFNIPDKVVVSLRFFGPVFVIQNHWFSTKKGKKFPLACAAYDSATQSFAQGKCPVEEDFNIPLIVEEAKKINPSFNEETDPNIKEIKAIKAHIAGFGHVVVRTQNFQSNERGITRPWQPIKLPPSVLFSLIKLKSMNRCSINGKTYEADIADPYWGRDIHIMYNSSERNPQARYMITLGDHTPLSDLEKSYIPQLYSWKDLIEYPTYDEVKQVLNVNGYYTMLNQLKGIQTFGDIKQNAYAHMEQYLPQVPKSPYESQMPMGVPQQVPSMPVAMNNYPSMIPQQQTQQQQIPPQYQQPPMPQSQQYQPPMPQYAGQHNQQQPPKYYPPNPVAVGYGSGITEVDFPEASPIPENVPMPMGAGQQQQQQEDDFEIPFDELPPAQSQPVAPVATATATATQRVQQQAMPQQAASNKKTYSVKGKSNGVTPQAFQVIINDFGTNLARGKPFKLTEDSELEGLQVLACYGSYCGDLNCVKCPLRSYCLHA